MRCKSCDEILTDFEATRRHRITKKFLDLCNICYNDLSSPPPVIVRHDLAHDNDDYVFDNIDDDLDTLPITEILKTKVPIDFDE